MFDGLASRSRGDVHSPAMRRAAQGFFVMRARNRGALGIAIGLLAAAVTAIAPAPVDAAAPPVARRDVVRTNLNTTVQVCRDGQRLRS